KGIDAAQKALKLNPDLVFAYDSLAVHNLHLGRLGEAEKTLSRAAALNFENPDFLVLRFCLAFLQDDQAGMERELKLAAGKNGAQETLLHQKALVLAYS